MLPSGHIAGGYLTALAAAELFGANLPELREPSLIAFGTFMAFAPDLDMFYKFFQVKRWYFSKETDNPRTTHRHLLSHAPLLYLAIGLILLLLGLFWASTLIQSLAVLVVLGSWSHFLLDSSGYGIKWLWPFSSKLYSLLLMRERSMDSTGFWNFWTSMVKHYLRRPEAYLEIIIILTALAVFIIRN